MKIPAKFPLFSISMVCALIGGLLSASPAAAVSCVAAASYAPGSGTGSSSADPILIGTAGELTKLSDESNTTNLTKYYKLTTDIDLAGCSWTPIGNYEDSSHYFSGYFDGDGHTISNLVITDTDNTGTYSGFIGRARFINGSTWYTGLFDVGFENASITSQRAKVGIAVGGLEGNFSGIYATGTVQGRTNVGGLIGDISLGGLNNGVAKNSYSLANVVAETTVANYDGSGGFVGVAYYVPFETSYSTGTVTTLDSSTYVGGFVGTRYALTASTYGAGGVVSSFYDSTTSGLSYTGSGDPKTTTQMTTLSTFANAGYDIVAGWLPYDPANNQVWGMSSSVNSGYPYLLYQYSGAVTFDANGGTGTMSEQVGSSGDNLPSNAFQKTGYNFDGWNSVADGSGTAYADASTYAFSGNTTLYAQWSLPTPVPTATPAAATSEEELAATGTTLPWVPHGIGFVMIFSGVVLLARRRHS